jgi:hypothetical protein
MVRFDEIGVGSFILVSIDSMRCDAVRSYAEVISLCPLCLCGGPIPANFFNHRDTENTKEEFQIR